MSEEGSKEHVILGRAGRFELLVEVASGGMATVYLACDWAAQPPSLVALKRPHRHLAKDETYIAMLLDEARLAEAIDHENVVKVRELGYEGKEPFIVLDYVEGASLSELRKILAMQKRTLDYRVAARIALDALRGLAAAHDLHDASGKPLGIIHRDISPHNILIRRDGRAFLTDFGIAKAADRVQVTRTHEVKGKVAYLAPERVDRRRMCTVQSDVFAMGSVLWECIAGRRLFEGEETVDILQEVISAQIPSLVALGAPIPKALDDAILKSLARNLERRFATAAEFADAIEAALVPPHDKAGLASHDDVGRAVHIVFGGSIRARHNEIKKSLEKDEGAFEKLALVPIERSPDRPTTLHPTELLSFFPLAPAGLPKAPAPRPSGPPGQLGVGTSPTTVQRRKNSTLILGGAAIISVGIVVTAVLTRNPAPPRTLVTHTVAPPAPPRTVDFALPFLSTRVAVDDTQRELTPAVDRVSFSVTSSGTRHRIVAFALDGTRAEGWAHETESGATMEGSGYTVDPPQAPSEVIELPEDTNPAPTSTRTIAPLPPPNRPPVRPPKRK